MTNERDQHQMSGRIPDVATREEAAAFWDAQDVTEVLVETRSVKLRVGKHLSQGLTVRLDRSDREELERRASAQGIGPSTLVRMWIKERLRQVG